MSSSVIHRGAAAVLTVAALPDLFALLRQDGFQPVGPTIRDGYLVLDCLEGPDDLPRGWTTEAAAGFFRLQRRQDEAYFGFNLGQESWKKYLYPARVPLVTATRHDDAISFAPTATSIPAYACIGVRPCELAAIAVQDRILLHGPVIDPDYAARRQAALIIAVDCTEADSSCFCASLGTGPAAAAGFDLALTELCGTDGHFFLVQTGSERGERLLTKLPRQPVMEGQWQQAQTLVAAAAGSQTRSLATDGLPGLLYDRTEHPHWDDVAARCLSCGSCALVCPTCFCFSMAEETDLANMTATRWRRWEVCHNLDHSYIHGGWLRPSIKARYRQWLTHKLAAWLDQFGCLGCTGCGRCLVWCPVAIDLTAELQALRQPLLKE